MTLNRDKPLGQRLGDGYHFGHLVRYERRAQNTASVTRKREQSGWTDRIGQPHGRSSDKLRRKVMQGKVGLRHGRGPYAAWHLRAK